MREAGGHLRSEVATTRLLQGSASLGFFGDVHRQDVDPTLTVRGEGHADTAGRAGIGEFEHGFGPTVGGFDMRGDARIRS